jgi:hypothetical protein
MALRRGANKAVESARPTCNPCQDDHHGRCATVLGPAYLDVIETRFDCACYHRSIENHQAAADENQDEVNSHFGRADWDPEGRSYYASQRREYQNWAEEM